MSPGPAAQGRAAPRRSMVPARRMARGGSPRHGLVMTWPAATWPNALASAEADARRAFRQFLAKAFLVDFRHGLAFQLVAFVEEGHAEGESVIAAEDFGILRPGDDGARAHHRREIAIHEGVPREDRKSVVEGKR